MAMVNIQDDIQRQVRSLASTMLTDLDAKIQDVEERLKVLVRGGASQAEESQRAFVELARLRDIHRHVTVTGLVNVLLTVGLNSVEDRIEEVYDRLIKNRTTRGRPRLTD